MENILVLSTPFKITDKEWGHKWIGFYNGKRFKLIKRRIADFVYSETETEIVYTFSTDNEHILPFELNRMMYKPALSNLYFLYGKDKEMTVEIVMQLIEKGYDISTIKMIKYRSYFDTEEFLCRYINKVNGNIIVEVQTDKSILWKENVYD